MSTGSAVVLLSGGLDSYTAGAIVGRQGFRLYALTVRYGQRHAHEVGAARAVAAALGVARHLELDVDLRAFGGSSLTTDAPARRSPPRRLGDADDHEEDADDHEDYADDDDAPASAAIRGGVRLLSASYLGGPSRLPFRGPRATLFDMPTALSTRIAVVAAAAALEGRHHPSGNRARAGLRAHTQLLRSRSVGASMRPV